MKKPCIECGVPSSSSRCPEHRRAHRAKQVGSSRSRGYDSTWDRLSARARAASPFCEVCNGNKDLQLDHKPSAWIRKAEGKVIRLEDVRVLCRQCNVDAGSSRPQTHGTGPTEPEVGLRGKAQTPLLTQDGRQ